MAISAAIKFTQGFTTDLPGRAVVGATAALVTTTNGDDTDAVAWTWTMESVPIGSGVALGVFSLISSGSFTPDIPGPYLVHLLVEDAGANQVEDERVFSVPTALRSWIVPAFSGSDTAHNFGGQLRGWAGDGSPKLMDTILDEIENGIEQTLADTLANGNFTGTNDIVVTGGQVITSDPSVNLNVVAGAAAPASGNQGGSAHFIGGMGDGIGQGGFANYLAGQGGVTGPGGHVYIAGGEGGTTSGDATGVFIFGSNTLIGTTQGDGDGGFVNIIGTKGVGLGRDGGVVVMSAGDAGITGDGGLAFIASGSGGSTSGDDGDLYILTGNVFSPKTDGDGGDITILASSGIGTNRDGGAVGIVAGDATGVGIGGILSFTAGSGGATGVAGTVTVTGGAGGSSSGAGGDITISGGTPVDGNGGTIFITASNGVGTNRDGGDVDVTAGTATGSGSPGTINLNSDTVITGKLTVTGLIDPTGLVMDEQAATPFAFTAGKGTFWVRNDTPNVPMFTDDTGTDFVLGATSSAETTFTGTVQTVNNTPTVVATYTTAANNRVIKVEANSIGRDTAGDVAHYKIVGTFKRNGVGVVTQIGLTSVVHFQEQDSAWDATFSISGTSIRVEVTGDSANNTEWKAVGYAFEHG